MNSDPSRRLPQNILVTLTVDPAPIRAADEFRLKAASATDGYSVDEPVLIGQQPRNGGQALTVMLRICPSPPPPPPPVPWWILRPDPVAFGRAVRSARNRAGLSQAELSRRAGVSEMTIRNLEYGACPSPKTRNAVLEVLANAGQELSAAEPDPQKEEDKT